MQTITDTSVRAEIRRMNDALEAGFVNGDPAAITGLYTDEAEIFPTGSAPIKGKTAIQSFWQKALDGGVKRSKVTTMSLDELGDTAIEIGHYTMFGANEQQLDEGKLLVVWKKQDGQWRLHRDIWNTNLPAPGSAK